MRIRPNFPVFGVAAACVLISIPALGQTSNPTSIERDAQAITLVQTAISAMGGASKISQIQNAVVIGTSIDAADASSTASSFTWTQSGVEFRYEIDSTNGGHILVSDGVSAEDFHDGIWTLAPPVMVRTELCYHIPALVLLEEYSNPNYSIIFVGRTTLNGRNVIHILTRDDSDATGHSFTAQDWYFDSGTGLPFHVEHQVPISKNANATLKESIDFENYQTMNGVLVPYQLGISEGQSTFSATITSFQFNTAISPTVFSPGEAQAQ